MSLQEMRKKALRLFDVAIRAADPAAALGREFARAPVVKPAGKTYVIAVGKAAVPMMRETLAAMPQTPSRALCVTNPENLQPLAGAEIIPGGHPVPNKDSLEAGEAVIALLAETTADDHVIALISGGGSALMAAPRVPLSLSDKINAARAMLAAGLDITQMNHIRQQMSELKGGGLSRHAAPARVTSYILSDVIGDDLRVIASGPTAAPIGTQESAQQLARSFGLSEIAESLSKLPDVPTPANTGENHLICSNRHSLDAICAAAPDAKIMTDALTGDVANAAERIVAAVKSTSGPCLLIAGGETTVNLTGTGMGGRNQELALRVALLLRDLPGQWVFLSGGTDGRDGPTDAAGGLVDNKTLGRMTDIHTNPEALLDNNASYDALAASDDLIIIGGTGTNVADIQIFLRAP